jgi:hypothetical protein
MVVEQSAQVYHPYSKHSLSINQSINQSINIQKAQKSNTSAKGLLGIAKKLMIFLAIPSKLSCSCIFDFSALLGDNLN